MQPQLHHCCQSSGLSYTVWHMNSQRPLKKKEILKGNTSNFSMTDPMSVKPVVSAKGAPCQTSQTGLVHQACIIGEGCSPQARWQWTEVKSHNACIYILIKIWLFVFAFENFQKRYSTQCRYLYCNLYLNSWFLSLKDFHFLFQKLINIMYRVVCCVCSPEHNKHYPTFSLFAKITSV